MAPLLFLAFLLLSQHTSAQDGGPYCIKVEEDVCSTVSREDCVDEERQSCTTVQERNCVPFSEESCSLVPSPEDKCTTVDKQVCRDVDRTLCVPSPASHCVKVKKWVCPSHHGDFICRCVVDLERKPRHCIQDCERRWSRHWCWTEIEEKCAYSGKKKAHCVTVKETKCENVPEVKCVPTKELSCETIQRENCTNVDVEQCTPFTENVCRTVEEQQCEKEMVDRFCTNDTEGRLRASIFNGDVAGAAAVLTESDELFSLGAGMAYLEEQTFLVTRTADRANDPDVVAFRAVATSALDGTDVEKLVNVILLSVIPDCRCRERTAAEFDAIASGLREDLSDQAYLNELVDADFSEFEGRSRRKLLGTSQVLVVLEGRDEVIQAKFKP